MHVCRAQRRHGSPAPRRAAGDGSGGEAWGAGSCYGCGAVLQTVEPENPGWVDAGEYALKAKHRQRGLLLCSRCRSLSHGRPVPGVVDIASTAASMHDLNKRLATPEELREKLK